MKGFKGFDKGLVCRGKQYKENTVFEEEAAEICKSGMHFCENPFDVLEHYDLVNTDGSCNEFAEVEALDECLRDDNKKYCTKKLKIGAKLSFSGLVNACIEFILEKTKIEETDEEDETVIGSSRYYAQIGSSRRLRKDHVRRRRFSYMLRRSQFNCESKERKLDYSF